jgi:hypothetical protein
MVRASGVDVFHTMLVMQTGTAWALPAANAQRKCSRRADEGIGNTGLSWSDPVTLWALADGHHRTPVHSTRKAAMAGFAKSWRGEYKAALPHTRCDLSSVTSCHAASKLSPYPRAAVEGEP